MEDTHQKTPLTRWDGHSTKNKDIKSPNQLLMASLLQEQESINLHTSHSISQIKHNTDTIRKNSIVEIIPASLDTSINSISDVGTNPDAIEDNTLHLITQIEDLMKLKKSFDDIEDSTITSILLEEEKTSTIMKVADTMESVVDVINAFVMGDINEELVKRSTESIAKVISSKKKLNSLSSRITNLRNNVIGIASCDFQQEETSNTLL
jgi:hypothetical protein